MKKRLFFFILFCICVKSTWSQELPTIIPPSPEATSLAKFTEIPVSHYTGLPNINVPIYEIDFEGLKIPIGLSYHARGIKVEEIASRVGIGWALNAGGVITRQIRGKNDFGANGYYGMNYYDDFETNPTTRHDLLDIVEDREDDLIPDQYFFNFLGYSGKFIFDQKTKEPVLQGYDDLKIEKNVSWDDGFIITTKDGFQFYFGKAKNATRTIAKSKEDVTPQSVSVDGAIYTGPPAHTSTWHLVDIVSPTGAIVKFNYNAEFPKFYRRSYDETLNNIQTSYISNITGTQCQLSEIIFSQGKVKFISETNDRDDLKDAFALSSIEVENHYKRIKKYNFNYSYSYNNSSSNIHPLLYLYEEEAKRRLFLDSIQLISNNNSSQLYRAFEYTNKNGLPNRFSNSQDLWGYYNGKNNGLYLPIHSYGSQEINREVDVQKAQFGLINKVSYPTGGYTAYTFEENQAIIPSYFEHIYYNNPNPIIDDKLVVFSKGPFTLINSTSQRNTYESAVFEVLNSDVGPINVQVALNGDASICELNGNSQNSNCNYVISIVDENSQPVNINGTPLILYKVAGTASYDMAIEPLQSGRYKIRAEISTGIDSPDDRDNSFLVYLRWSRPTYPDNPDLIFSGGNRIKKIENFSTDNGKITRTYKYLREDGTSSGLVFSLPSYIHYGQTPTLVNGVQVIPGDNKITSAIPGGAMTYDQGNHVGYSHVTEFIDSESQQGSGGKTEYQFTTIPDTGEFYKFPYCLSTNNEWLRGKPLSIEYYKKTDTQDNYNIVKKEEFIYKYADEFSSNVLSDPYNPRLELGDPTPPRLNYIENSLKFYRPLILFSCKFPLGTTNLGIDENCTSDDYKVYFLTSGVQKLFSKKETLYNANGEVSTTTQYNYDYDNHYQVAGSEMTNSKGEVYTTDNNYNVLDNPVFRILPTKTTTKKGGVKIAEHNTNYKNFGNLYNLPENVQTSKGSQALQDRITYHEYDDKGNLLEVSKADGMHIYYIWGYNSEYPVAKLENFTTSQVAAIQGNITTAVNASNADNSVATENTLRSALANLRNAASNAMVTTYTYDPLIGITSVTDPKGYTMYYEYDEFNRLKHVKDADGNILSKNEYSYKQ